MSFHLTSQSQLGSSRCWRYHQASGACMGWTCRQSWSTRLIALLSDWSCSITRAGFGEHKVVCILIPSIFLVTSIVIDIVLLFHGQGGALDIQRPYEPQSGDETYDPETDPLTNMDEQTGLVFVFATLANTMVFFMVRLIRDVQAAFRLGCAMLSCRIL